jgi:Xaa-Pro aminopeptidase
MKMMNTALLTGPYDWDPVLLPLSEFAERLAAVRRVLAEQGANALLVHGNSIEHGALAYLTGFIPKLAPAFALVPLDGPICILASGGPGMIGSAKLLTWVEDVQPLGNLRNSLSEWLGNFARNGRAVIGLWGGNKIARRPYLAASVAIQEVGAIIDLDEPLDSLRRRKSPLELRLLRESCRILAIAGDVFERAASGGSGARTAALAAERAAYAHGAQDFRILASARSGGPPLPLDGPADLHIVPILACLAVRFAGYWSEGFVTVAPPPHGALAHAKAALKAMLQGARSGATSSDLHRAAAPHLSPYKFHPMVESALGNGIGLSLEESPIPSRNENFLLEADCVYTLRCGAMGEGSDNAIVSSMVVVSETGANILWPSKNYPADPEILRGSR